VNGIHANDGPGGAYGTVQNNDAVGSVCALESEHMQKGETVPEAWDTTNNPFEGEGESSDGHDAVVDTAENKLEVAACNVDAVENDEDFGGFTAFEGTSSDTIGTCGEPNNRDPDNGEISEQHCEAAAQSGGDVFGGFSSSAEAIPSETEAKEESAAHDGTVVKVPEIEGDGNLGEFASFEIPPAIQLAAVASSAGDDGFGSFEAFSADAPHASLPDVGTSKSKILTSEPLPTVGSAVEDEFGDFGDFDAHEDTRDVAPEHDEDDAESDQLASNPAEEEIITNQPSTVSSRAHYDNDECGGFGNFNAFEESPNGASPDAGQEDSDKKAPSPAEEAAASQPSAVASTAHDDDQFGDFGDSDAIEETPDEVPQTEGDQNAQIPAREEAPASQTPAIMSTTDGLDDEFGDFDDFDAFEDTPEKTSTDNAQKKIEEKAHTPADAEAPGSQASVVAASADDADDEFREFGDFDAFEEGPAEEASPEVAETEGGKKLTVTVNEEVPAANQSSTNAASADDASDEFGDFGSFDAFEDAPAEDVSPDVAETEGDQNVTTPAKEEAPATQSSAADDADDEFGDFGDFDAFEEAPPGETAPTESKQPSPKPAEEGAPTSHPSAVASSADDADDEFSDFGDFDAFEEAPPGENASTENEQPAPKPVEEGAPASQPSAVASSADENGDEFGDFGDFDEFEAAPAAPQTESKEKDVSTPRESSPRPVLSILNESIRAMFLDVFASDTTVSSEFEGKCSELPFDIPMRNILPKPASAEKKEAAVRSHQSERELGLMKGHFRDLPRSPPLTILSDEKWYPYSQYEFHRDGSPYADTAERTTTPSVPEVLSIDLPTGFEASNLTPSTSSKPPARSYTPPPSSNRAAPTVVDFPSTPKNNQSTVVKLPPKLKSNEPETNDVNNAQQSTVVNLPPKLKSNKRETNNVSDAQQESEESGEVDYSQLSAIGKQFMEQLPDLSYMLKSTLSLPNDKK